VKGTGGAIGSYAINCLDHYLPLRAQQVRSGVENVFILNPGNHVCHGDLSVIGKYLPKYIDIKEEEPARIAALFATHLMNQGADIRP
jgi:site-specific recombinase XerD